MADKPILKRYKSRAARPWSKGNKAERWFAITEVEYIAQTEGKGHVPKGEALERIKEGEVNTPIATFKLNDSP